MFLEERGNDVCRINKQWVGDRVGLIGDATLHQRVAVVLVVAHRDASLHRGDHQHGHKRYGYSELPYEEGVPGLVCTQV